MYNWKALNHITLLTTQQMVTTWGDMLMSLIVAIISWCTPIPNHFLYNLNECNFNLSIIPQWSWKKNDKLSSVPSTDWTTFTGFGSGWHIVKGILTNIHRDFLLKF